ncbi:hypothetical protein G6F70_007791 [Rhizopus microsporus]|uniref:Uncharacterized protein n=1 Tax=Rhizopus microsporus TaxID=58291 RepID=A0A1X0RRF5_RHIZD|nr:hypothetical protein G6F70_007791 [Rhizopus microsporus]KAG1207846.1 hypothetical protein G6F69_007710 [Rhizopus microsporus]KAG1228790.1 hypothetical protein G6F67_007593 [Rhizopus microsporus]KAG1260792.1 hypothetical protein G6F68_007168 [Rhizopus microsporus]ORE14570.1 hypothetical protein BCV71DRAFT_229199 [Rhizopus microsporus]
MATTTLQHANPISLHSATDDEDIALSNYLTNNNTLQQSPWIQHGRPRKPSNNCSISLQKPTSTPIRPKPSSSERRKSNLNNTILPSQETLAPRRPSIASSIQSGVSEVSTSSKVSFSKRLRKVFSMSNIKSNDKDLSFLRERNGSNASVASSASSVMTTESTASKLSFRRRSIASLTNLFQKSSIQEPIMEESNNNEGTKKKPELRVDVNHKRKGGMKARNYNNTHNNNNYHNITPDSPNSAVSSRSSFSRLPPPVITNNSNQRFPYHPEGLPSPTPSSSSSSNRHPDEVFKKPNPVGLHYGIGLHSSPKLKPTASSSSSSLVCTNRRIQFCSTIQVHETFSASDYDRRCDANATCQKLTPVIAMKIKQELNEYKLTEMEVHVESRQYTHFFL